MECGRCVVVAAVVFVSAAAAVLVVNLCKKMVLGVEEDELVPDFRSWKDCKKFLTLAGVVVVAKAALTKFAEVTNVRVERVTVDGNRPCPNLGELERPWTLWTGGSCR